MVALVGLSGVGKSTLIRRAHGLRQLVHLQASDLIKGEQARRTTKVSSSEELRLGPVADNQHLLIAGFAAVTEGVGGLIVFDGHVTVFGADGATDIPSTVFSALGCAAIVMMEAEPRALHERRSRDASRKRPEVDEATLSRQQAHCAKAAARIASELGIPFRRIPANPPDMALAALLAVIDQGI